MNHILSYIYLACFLLTTAFAQSYEKMSEIFPVDYTLADVEAHIYTQHPQLVDQGFELAVKHDIESPGGRHLYFAQTYQGIPLYRAGIKVNMGHDGRIWSHMSELAMDIVPTVGRWSFDPDRLYDRYVEQLGVRDFYLSQVWAKDGGQYIPAYALEVTAYTGYEAYRILVDARNGREISRVDAASYHAHTNDSARALIFHPDPCTRAEVAYGVQFTDNNDQHSALLGSLMDTVTLQDVSFENGVYSLQGPYVSVEDIAPFSFPPATSTDGTFYFTREDNGFEDVMVYYHIDQYQRYIQSLGFNNLQNNPLRVDPHGFSNLDQSAFFPNGGNSYLAFGDGGVDDAEDADVIIHEYGHALSFAAAPGSNAGLERQGLDEGIGDYLAAAYSQDINDWNWFEVFNWDGHNEFWSGRQANVSFMYPPSSSSIYVYGELWATVLMEARAEVGNTEMDRIFLQELYANVGGMTFSDAAQLILEADSILYGGAHTEVLTRVFCDRSLLQGVSCLPVSQQRIEPTGKHGRLRTLSATRYELAWETPATPYQLQVYNSMGQLLTQQTGKTDTPILLDLSDRAAGIYILNVQTEKGQEMYRLRVQ